LALEGGGAIALIAIRMQMSWAEESETEDRRLRTEDSRNTRGLTSDFGSSSQLRTLTSTLAHQSTHFQFSFVP